MSIFADTSAFYAMLDTNDTHHKEAGDAWLSFASRKPQVACTNYVLLETFALVQHRLGMHAVRTMQEDIVPVLGIIWIDAEAHHAAVQAILTAGRRQLSLVDCTSFDAMRRLGIRTAFTFDPHFAEQGFECVP